MQNQLHIISFNVPFPADYGGAIDVFYSIKALSKLGLEIHLHCFEYGRAEAAVLKELCTEVHYYPRKKSPQKLFGKLPYIVSTRDSEALLDRLKKDNAPILFHGTHCCYLLDHPDLALREKCVRMHNIEWQYYRDLAYLETRFLKRKYLESESKKLKTFELEVVKKHANRILAISRKDEYYLSKNQFRQVAYIPAFHAHDRIDIATGLGDYALFHGDLSVRDNEQSALFLIEEVFNDMEYPLVITGKNPSKKITSYEDLPNIKIVANPSYEAMNKLMRQAQMHTLLTQNEAGMKLKLLQALYTGRHIIINEKMKGKEQIESMVHICRKAEEWKATILSLSQKSFSKKDILFRERNLSKEYEQLANAKKLQELLQIRNTVKLKKE